MSRAEGPCVLSVVGECIADYRSADFKICPVAAGSRENLGGSDKKIPKARKSCPYLPYLGHGGVRKSENA